MEWNSLICDAANILKVQQNIFVPKQFIGGYAQPMAVCLQCSKGNSIMSHWSKQFKDFVKKKCKGILTISARQDRPHG